MSSNTRIEQIISWSSRRGKTELNTHIDYQLKVFHERWKNGDLSDETIMSLIPIRITTLIEVLVRDLVRQLVDHGDPYLERCEPLLKTVKIDFSVLSHVHSRNFSIGDLLAHSLNVSSWQKIVNIFEYLIGQDFLVRLSSQHDRWKSEVEQKPPSETLIISDMERVKRSISELFEVRHILTHEFPLDYTLESRAIDRFFLSASEFIFATMNLVDFLLFGDYPLTQTEMNFHAASLADRADEEMRTLIMDVTELSVFDKNLLRQSQGAWVQFCDAESSLHASRFEGGSMQPLIYSSAKEELTKARIEQLRDLKRQAESDV